MIVESFEDVVRISGALRTNYWDTLHTAISLVLKRSPAGVIIEGSGITELTPSGAETFRSVMEFIHRHEARVIVTALPEPVLEVLRSVPDVRSQLPIAASVEEARRSLNLLGEPEGKKRRKSPDERASRLLVSLEGREEDGELLRFAMDFAESRDAVLVLVYAVKVPRDLPLTAPLPEEEATAEQTLESARAWLDGRGKVCDARIERCRDLAGALADVLEDVPAELVFIGLPQDEDEGSDLAAKRVRSVNAKLAVPVLYFRPRINRR